MQDYINSLKTAGLGALRAISPTFGAASNVYNAVKKKPAPQIVPSAPAAVGPATTVKATVSPAVKTPAAQSYIQSQMATQPTTQSMQFTKPVYAQNPNQNPDGTPIVSNTPAGIDAQSYKNFQSANPGLNFTQEDLKQYQSAGSAQTPSARDAYIAAYKAYQDAQTKTAEVSKAKQAYNDFMAQQAKSVAGREGRGLGIPLEIVRGEQERLLKQTQPELARLQGDIGIAQGDYETQVGAAKSGLDFQKDLLGIEKEAQKPIIVDGVAYSQQADGSLKPLTSKTQTPSEQYGSGSLGEYAFAKSQGYTGSFTDYQNEDANRKAKATGTGGLTPYQQFQATQSISKDNATRTANAREISRQTSLMNQAYNSFITGGDKNVSTQAIISTFNKILDPTSVVRESEYDRTAQGQSLIARIQGKYDNITQGGAGVTPETLKAAVDLANDYLRNAQDSLIKENERSQAIASQFGINPQFVTSGGVGQAPQEPSSFNEFSDIAQHITPDPATKTAYIPRAVWATLGNRMDALLADVASDGYTLKIRD